MLSVQYYESTLLTILALQKECTDVVLILLHDMYNLPVVHKLFPCNGFATQAQRVCTIRDSRGDDEMAACGQLGSLESAAIN